MKLISVRPETPIKPWYFSRIIWINILGIIAMVVTMFGVQAEEWATIEAGILAIINLVLRLRTNQGLE
jgi:hypothetical protein